MGSMIDIDDLADNHEGRKDYRRANGSPLVSNPNDPSKTERYRRPSSYGKPLDDENALVEWKLWKAMQGVARSSALQAQVAACKDEDKITKKELRETALDRGAANEKADLGTGLHAMTARIEDPKDLFEIPDQYVQDLKAYGDELERLGLVSEYIEVHIVNDDFRAAGTADRIYRTTKPLVTPEGETLPPGTLVLGDIKTGTKLDFGLPAYCVQMAIYATGRFYDIHSESRIETPPINNRWMLLMHLPVGKGRCDAMWLDINVGLHGAFLTFEVLKWRNQWKSGSAPGFNGYQVPDPFDAEEAIIETFDAVEVDGDASTPSPEEYIAAINERIAQIGDHADARKMLTHTWPKGVPTPKRGLSEPEHILAVMDVLDEIEKRYSLPFVGMVVRGPDRIPGDL